MVDKNVILKRAEQIDKHLEKISPYSTLSKEDFLKDEKAQDIVEYNLFQIINHLIDIVQHIVVDENYGLPQSNYDASYILCEKGVFGNKDLDLLKKMIGFRNTIGHDYITLDKELVYSTLIKGEKDIRDILSKLTGKFL